MSETASSKGKKKANVLNGKLIVDYDNNRILVVGDDNVPISLYGVGPAGQIGLYRVRDGLNVLEELAA